jgi:murein DD-endopeptidase MepM/ murein hydrolase activator NlpD
MFGAVSVFGFLSSYVRMSLKVANYNNLRQEIDGLRTRYQRLEKESKKTDQQLASLQMLATEVSVAYGLKHRLEGPSDISSEGRLAPTLSESIERYNFLKSASLSRYSRGASQFFQNSALPNLWPVNGVLLSHFGNRTDPFSGEGAFHTGVDISAVSGTPVKCTADGIVTHAEYNGRYGRLVVVDHGNGIQTYYAHLSRFEVVPGQGIHRGDMVGLSGASGRVTSPHLHYEVRRGGLAVNPHQYLHGPVVSQATLREFSF